MALIVGTNTYLTLEEANTYFESRLYNTAWLNASADDKEKALIMATQKIDNLDNSGFGFIDSKYDISQKLEFPRTDGIVPEKVKKAACEEALAILSRGNSKRTQLIEQGVTSFSLGDMSESFNKIVSHKSLDRYLLSGEARNLMQSFLKKIGSVPVC